MTSDVLRPGLLLALLAALGVGLLAGVHALTAERIATQERLVLIERLEQVLPQARYDNDPLGDARTIRAQDVLGHDRPVRIFRARLGDSVSAVVLETVAPDGYNGDIHLLIGIDRDGSVLGARVLKHRETPGLGDPIEARRSDWILDFTGRALGDPPLARWTVRPDGGEFDAFTGATITPRAVTRALARALVLFETRREQWLNDAPWGPLPDA